MASASTGAEPKSSSASRGLSTMGRPTVLRLVLTTTGISVSSSKVVSRVAVRGSSEASTV